MNNQKTYHPKKFKWKIWKSIKTRPYKDILTLEKAFKRGGYEIDERDESLLSIATLRPFPLIGGKELNLLIVTPKDVGFKIMVGQHHFFDRVLCLNQGFELCGAEMGPQLRLLYPDQPNNESLSISMNPVLNQNGDLRIFHVENKRKKLLLHSDFGDPDCQWPLNHRFVFVNTLFY